MQVFVLQPISPGSPLSVESNAGKATDRGGEIELKTHPAEGWLISGAVGYVVNGASVLLHTDWNYRGDYYVNADNLHNPYIPGRTIGNVRAVYTSRSDRWELGSLAQERNG